MDVRTRKFGSALVTATAFFLAAWVLGGARPAVARQPKDELKETIEQVLKILRDPSLKGEDKVKVRRERLRKAIDPRFDYEEMAKRSLARYWRRRTPEERRDFVEVFKDLLERSYVDKIERYTDEKVLYPTERVDKDYAEVKTKIIPASGRDVPVDYRLHKTAGGWRVYDVVIEGVSLVQNYRSQFKRIIRKDSYAELLRKMKAKRQEIQ